MGDSELVVVKIVAVVEEVFVQYFVTEQTVGVWAVQAVMVELELTEQIVD